VATPPSEVNYRFSGGCFQLSFMCIRRREF
jgi:hypothetical protein